MTSARPVARRSKHALLLRKAAFLVCALAACSFLSGCIVAGVSSSGGFFLWPGSLGLLVLIIVVVLVMRRR